MASRHVEHTKGEPNQSSDLFHNDKVPSNVKFSQSIAMLYVFEDNEAVIRMLIKGRSPTMRHVSRTHRDALVRSFDRINLDPKIKIKYIDTKHQVADILTEGHFTRDAWNNLPCLFNISHCSSLCCAKNSSLISCTERMAKRMQEQEGDNRIVAKSLPTDCQGKGSSRKFLRMAKGCSTVHQHRETCGNGQGSEVSESAGKICHQHRGTCGN